MYYSNGWHISVIDELDMELITLAVVSMVMDAWRVSHGVSDCYECYDGGRTCRWPSS